MIVDAILSALLALVGVIADALPDWTPPAWLDGSDSAGTLGHYFAVVGSYIGQLKSWIPGDVLFSCINTLAGVVVVCLGIRAIRWALSMLTGGGGA